MAAPAEIIRPSQYYVPIELKQSPLTWKIPFGDRRFGLNTDQKPLFPAIFDPDQIIFSQGSDRFVIRLPHRNSVEQSKLKVVFQKDGQTTPEPPQDVLSWSEDTEKNNKRGEKGWYKLTIDSPWIVFDPKADIYKQVHDLTLKYNADKLETFRKWVNDAEQRKLNQQKEKDVLESIAVSFKDYFSNGLFGYGTPFGKNTFSFKISDVNKIPYITTEDGKYKICDVTDFNQIVKQFMVNTGQEATATPLIVKTKAPLPRATLSPGPISTPIFASKNPEIINPTDYPEVKKIKEDVDKWFTDRKEWGTVLQILGILAVIGIPATFLFYQKRRH